MLPARPQECGPKAEVPRGPRQMLQIPPEGAAAEPASLHKALLMSRVPRARLEIGQVALHEHQGGECTGCSGRPFWIFVRITKHTEKDPPWQGYPHDLLLSNTRVPRRSASSTATSSPQRRASAPSHVSGWLPSPRGHRRGKDLEASKALCQSEPSRPQHQTQEARLGSQAGGPSSARVRSSYTEHRAPCLPSRSFRADTAQVQGN